MATRTLPVPRPRLLIGVVVTLVVLIIAATLYVRLYTDLLLFRSLSASKVFTTVLGTRILLFVVFGLIMAIAVGANIVIAYRLRPPFRPLSLEQQNLERYRVSIEPFQLLLLIVVSALFGILAGASASGRWQTWLLWRHRRRSASRTRSSTATSATTCSPIPFQRFLLGFLFWVVLVSPDRGGRDALPVRRHPPADAGGKGRRRGQGAPIGAARAVRAAEGGGLLPRPLRARCSPRAAG